MTLALQWPLNLHICALCIGAPWPAYQARFVRLAIVRNDWLSSSDFLDRLFRFSLPTSLEKSI
jgi:hypothetical protein